MTGFLTSPELGFPPSRILLSKPEAGLGRSAAARRSTTSAASPRAPMGTTARAKPGSGAGTEVVAASSTPSAPRRRAITPAATRRRVGERSEIPGEGVAGRAGGSGSGVGGSEPRRRVFCRLTARDLFGPYRCRRGGSRTSGAPAKRTRGRRFGREGFRVSRLPGSLRASVVRRGHRSDSWRPPWTVVAWSPSIQWEIRSKHTTCRAVWTQNSAEFCRPIWATGCQRVREVWECCCCYQLRERKKSKKKGRNKV